MKKRDDDMFTDKILLITGGTGSFGNAVLERFLESDLKEIRIFSRDEKKQDDMRKKYSNTKITFYIGDVRDINSIRDAVRGVDFIFHAAALKQVPSCEFFPMEAVKTNIMGTDNVLTAAIEAGVKKVVCLSTDKAAYPINAMGASKAMMEKVFVAKARNVNPAETLICGTRYGNVMATRGSVIPLFVEQLKAGLPLTVTEGFMTRFMMNLEEAVDLVLFAFEHAEQGDIMVQKSTASTIYTLIEALGILFKQKPEIRQIGIRHGEKMYESLLTKEEAVQAIDLGDFYRIPADKRDLNYENFFEKGNISGLREEYNSNTTRLLTPEELAVKLLQLPYIQQELEKMGVAT